MPSPRFIVCLFVRFLFVVLLPSSIDNFYLKNMIRKRNTVIVTQYWNKINKYISWLLTLVSCAVTIKNWKNENDNQNGNTRERRSDLGAASLSLIRRNYDIRHDEEGVVLLQQWRQRWQLQLMTSPDNGVISVCLFVFLSVFLSALLFINLWKNAIRPMCTPWSIKTCHFFE